MKKDQNSAVLERDVRELSLGDMVIQVFRRWKAIVIITIIGALLFTGLSCYLGVSGPKAHAARAAAEEAAANAGTPTVDEVTQMRLDGMTQLQSHYRAVAVSQGEYVRNSIYMRLDPYAVPRATAVFWVLPEGDSTEEEMDGIITLYSDLAASHDVLDPIAAEYGIEYWALREVVGCGTDFDRNRLWPTVIYTDLDTSIAITNEIVNALQDHVDDFSAQFADHRLELASFTSRVGVETGVLDTQNNVWNYIHNNNVNIDKVGDDIDELGPEGEDDDSSFIIPAIRSIPMDIVIGAVIGFAVAFVALCIAYIGSDKLRSDDEVRRMAPVRVWANSIAPKTRSASDARMDRAQGMTPYEEGAYQRFADILAPELEGKNSLLVVTTLKESEVAEISGELEKALRAKRGEEAATEESSGFAVNVCANVSDSYTAVETIRGAEAVLAVERCHTSSLKKVRSELELLGHIREDALGVMVRGV